MSENEQIELKPKAKTGTANGPEVLVPDDSGSQALSEALQSSFSIVKFLMIGLVIVFLGSGLFTVDSGQQAIILRFGKPVGEGQAALLGPGFHWAFPKPIDEVKKVSIGQIQTATSTVGWYATTPEAEALKQEPPPRPTLNPAADGYVLTSDANIIHVRATLRYRITEPTRYLFEFVNAAEFVTNALNNSLLFATAHYTVDDILTEKAAAFREQVSSRMRELILSQQLGIEIEPVEVKTISPRQCQAEFAAVLETSIKSEAAYNKAVSESQGILSKARAEADSRINTAKAQQKRLVQEVEAEANTFAALLPQYQANPELYKQRRQTEVLGGIYEKANDTFFLSQRTDGKRELRLQLNREPQPPPPVKPE